ncbi:hypothetical protein CUR178_01844 [Leishmania enriettii]|uniref:Uncharacterized protein n=1 Tax=Leishmania enriettii TaxID=5663 RepID=A0A836H3F0_LEIEN|nr:hypothetical protein CUR178_01844 [Leishmania enriettii]
MPSSNDLTRGEYVNGLLVLVVAATTVVGYAGSVYWERAVAPHLFRCRELALEQEITELEREAAEICTTSNLYEHSRLTRRALRLRQELQAERRKRLAYECSVARVVSTLLDRVPFALGFGWRTGGLAPSAAAHGPVSKAGTGSTRSSCPDPSSTIASSSPMENDGAAYPPPAPRRRRVLGENVVNILYYNATTTVKYLLRFGSVLVLLCAFGNRRGLVAFPPSFEETLRRCAGKATAPFLLRLATYLTAALFVPGSGAPPTESHRSGATRRGADGMRGRFAKATPPASPASLMGTDANSSSDAGAAAMAQRLDIHVYSSGDLISWFLACYLAVYLVQRVLD